MQAYLQFPKCIVWVQWEAELSATRLPTFWTSCQCGVGRRTTSAHLKLGLKPSFLMHHIYRACSGKTVLLLGELLRCPEHYLSSILLHIQFIYNVTTMTWSPLSPLVCLPFLSLCHGLYLTCSRALRTTEPDPDLILIIIKYYTYSYCFVFSSPLFFPRVSPQHFAFSLCRGR